MSNESVFNKDELNFNEGKLAVQFIKASGNGAIASIKGLPRPSMIPLSGPNQVENFITLLSEVAAEELKQMLEASEEMETLDMIIFVLPQGASPESLTSDLDAEDFQKAVQIMHMLKGEKSTINRIVNGFNPMKKEKDSDGRGNPSPSNDKKRHYPSSNNDTRKV